MIFNYTCINQDNSKVEGVINANTKDEAVIELQKKGLTVVSIIDPNEEGGIKLDDFKKIQNLQFFKPKIKQKDIVIFSRQIATLFEAGVSALKGFRLLSAENENITLRENLNDVADGIASGDSLSKSLAKKPEIFSPFFISLVRAGEESGKLNETFLYLADYLDREYDLSQKTKKALTYPSFVVSVFFIIMFIMMTFVIPKMMAMFTEEGIELPLVTRIIVNISNFFVDYSIYMVPAAIAGFYMFKKWTKTPSGRYAVDSYKLRLPVFKNLFQKIFLTRLSDNMNTMLTSGVPILHAIEITSDTVDNAVHKELLLRVAEKVKNGTVLSKALYEEEYVPNILVQMVRIGEETGELGYILKNLANFYKREVDTAIDSVIGLIEPAMIVGLGLGVGVLVAAILLPMYNLSASIS